MAEQKSVEIKKKKKLKLSIPWIVALAILIVLSIVFGIYDLQIGYWAQDLRATSTSWASFGEFMDDEGQFIGFAWIGLMGLLYLFSFIPAFKERLGPTRKYTSYVLIVAVIGSLVLARFLKIFFARPRPGDVLNGEFAFAPLFAFGDWDILEAFSTGSFCSGHTATAGILFTIPFIFYYKNNKKLTAILYVIPIAYLIIMSLGRVVHGAHWPSDTLYGGYLLLGTCAIFYYKILKIPEQEMQNYPPMEQVMKIDKLAKSKPKLLQPLFEMWEIRYLIVSTITIIFALVFALGLKTSFLPDSLSTHFLSSWLVLHPEDLDEIFEFSVPFYLAIIMMVVGFLLTWIFADYAKSIIEGYDRKNYSIVRFYNSL